MYQNLVFKPNTHSLARVVYTEPSSAERTILMAANKSLNDLRYAYYANALGIPLTAAMNTSISDLEYQALDSGALTGGGGGGITFVTTTDSPSVDFSGAGTAASPLTATATGGAASTVSFTPVGNIASNNVQNAVQELDTEKLAIPTTTAIQTANFTAVTNRAYPVDCSSSNITCTLPTSVSDGSDVIVLLQAATSPFTVTVTATANHFNTPTGPTTISLVNPGDVLFIRWSSNSNAWLTLVQPLRNLSDGTYITWDTSTPGQIKPVISPNLVLNSIRLANVMLTSARCCTTMPLTTTYNNGSNGAGATLTATTNGVIPLIDNITLAVNERLLVNNQTNSFENGVYVATDLGSVSTPFILTRATDVDVAPDINGGVEVRIQEGMIWGTSVLRSFPSGPPITLGTTPIKFNGPPRPQISMADVNMGTSRDRKIVWHEFCEISTTPVTTDVTKLPGGSGGCLTYLTGTGAQVVQNEAAEPVVDGVCELSTGTTTTGRIAVAGCAGGVVSIWSATARSRYFCRVKIPVLTVNTTNMFVTRLGFLDPNSSTTTKGLYFELPADGSNVKAVSMHTSVATTVDTLQAQNTSFRSYAIDYDEVSGHALFYLSFAAQPQLVADINTNLPVGDVGLVPCIYLLKSSGTTAGTARADALYGFFPDNRGTTMLTAI